MNSGNGHMLRAAVVLLLAAAVAGADILQFDLAPRASLGLGYAASSQMFDSDGTARELPEGMRATAFSTDVTVKYRWKAYWFGTAFALKRIAYVSDISDRSHIGLGDLQSYLCRVDGPAMSGIRLTVPTGLYKYGLGGGAFALAPFVRYRYAEKLTVVGDLVYSFKNPDDVRAGASLGLHAVYQWHVIPFASFRYAWPDDDPWTSVDDSPSLLLTLGAEGRWAVTEKLGVYGRVGYDAWGRDVARTFRIGLGVFRR